MNKYNISSNKSQNIDNKNSNTNKDNIIIDALRYYDANQEKYFDLYRKIHHVDFKYTDIDVEHNKIIFYDPYPDFGQVNFN